MISPLARAGAVLAIALACTGAAFAGTSLGVEPLVTQVTVEPGNSVNIAVSIGSDADTPVRVIITPIDWRTRIDGSVAVEPLGTEGSHSLTPFLSMATYQFILQPREHRKVNLTVSLPAGFNPDPASYWGGFFVKATPLDAPPSTTGPAATVFVYNDVGKPKRHLTLQALRATAAKGDVRIVARYHNDGVGYIRSGMWVTVSQNGKTVHKEQVGLGAIFPAATRVVDQTVTGLPPGTYHVELDVDYGGDTVIVGETNVTVP
jgi:hypothetical protein